ncbi:16S rRNA (guanine(527)-N(7))-methyltransferase RsmG [Nocardioides sp. Bht2]|uniref:16S rRNA (guanine(527)-N(7))-methyltransferase RsmG n=1 Tax=Nocardioides sp. Bht2 TaxID=3392297 RepID=UPI0039B49A45
MFPSERLSLAERYTAWLADAGVVRGLIGPREVPRLWERHVLNCAVVNEALPSTPFTLCDIGSGAGLPGLVLAIMRPDAEITLVEPLLRRTDFLTEVADDLGLSNVTVHRGRAEDLAGLQQFDVVTSRAVAPLDRLLRWSMPLVAPTGQLVAMKGSSAAEEIETHAGVLKKLRCAPPTIQSVGAGVVDPQTTVVRVSWADPSRVSLPGAGRRTGSPSGKKNQRKRR